MSTNTALALRPLEAHELDIVSGAGVHVQTRMAAVGGPIFYVEDVVRFGWDGGATTVSKPVELLAYGSYENTRFQVFHP